MSAAARILVVDDTPQNVKLLADLLKAKGYEVATAADGTAALEKVAAEMPDLVLLDVMMPGMSGYEVCRKIREDRKTALLPVVLVTALDPQQERVKGIEAGADDFLSKPINQAELFARVKSLLRIKRLQDEVKDWNAKLEQRVREQVAQLERLQRLKRFFSPQLAELLVSEGEEMLKAHRREVNVAFLDLRGFTAFTERAAPEEVMALLRDYHACLGKLVLSHGGTLERFAGDSVMVFFNDPVPMEQPALEGFRIARILQAHGVEGGVECLAPASDDFLEDLADAQSEDRRDLSVDERNHRLDEDPCREQHLETMSEQARQVAFDLQVPMEPLRELEPPAELE